jgi:hypothetical protein
MMQSTAAYIKEESLLNVHISAIFIFCFADHESSIAQTNFQKLPLKFEDLELIENHHFLAFYLQLINITVFLYVNSTFSV